MHFDFLLKQGDITPVFNKWIKDYKINYRPIRFAQVIFKIFEKFTFKKIASFLDTFLSKFQNDWRKAFSAQKYFINLIENYNIYYKKRLNLNSEISKRLDMEWK